MDNFATFGDENYFPTMKMGVEQIRKLHPGSNIYVGDIGLRPDKKRYFEDNGCNVLDMTMDSEETGLYMIMKPVFIQAVMSRSPGYTCYIDGDAVIIKPLYLDTSALGTYVTTRVSRYGRINAGVVMTNDLHLVSRWIQRSILLYFKTKDYLSEQRALIELCDSRQFPIKEIPASEYNYPYIEKGIPDDVRVVHMKSNRWKKPELVKKVEDFINETSNTNS